MTWKRSPLLNFEILVFVDIFTADDKYPVVFVNIFTADDKYPVQDSENLQFLFQIQLSWKQKIFSEVFSPFMESLSNFNEFRKKDDCGS